MPEYPPPTPPASAAEATVAGTDLVNPDAPWKARESSNAAAGEDARPAGVKRVPSEAQVRASIENGSKGNGPKTDEGKRVASQNPTKHGFSNVRSILANPTPQQARDVQELLKAMKEDPDAVDREFKQTASAGYMVIAMNLLRVIQNLSSEKVETVPADPGALELQEKVNCLERMIRMAEAGGQPTATPKETVWLIPLLVRHGMPSPKLYWRDSHSDYVPKYLHSALGGQTRLSEGKLAEMTSALRSARQALGKDLSGQTHLLKPHPRVVETSEQAMLKNFDQIALMLRYYNSAVRGAGKLSDQLRKMAPDEVEGIIVSAADDEFGGSTPSCDATRTATTDIK